MQSDLQSVEKGRFSTFARTFAPKMCEIGISRLRMGRTVLEDLLVYTRYLPAEQFPASPGAQLQKIIVGIFSAQPMVNHDYDRGSDKKKRLVSIRSDRKSDGGDFLPLPPREAGNCSVNMSVDRSWRKVQPILRRERPLEPIFGQKLGRTC